jgi:hypothetical protein
MKGDITLFRPEVPFSLENITKIKLSLRKKEMLNSTDLSVRMTTSLMRRLKIKLLDSKN